MAIRMMANAAEAALAPPTPATTEQTTTIGSNKNRKRSCKAGSTDDTARPAAASMKSDAKNSQRLPPCGNSLCDHATSRGVKIRKLNDSDRKRSAPKITACDGGKWNTKYMRSAEIGIASELARTTATTKQRFGSCPVET